MESILKIDFDSCEKSDIENIMKWLNDNSVKIKKIDSAVYIFENSLLETKKQQEFYDMVKKELYRKWNTRNDVESYDF